MTTNAGTGRRAPGEAHGRAWTSTLVTKAAALQDQPHGSAVFANVDEQKQGATERKRRCQPVSVSVSERRLRPRE